MLVSSGRSSTKGSCSKFHRGCCIARNILPLINRMKPSDNALFVVRLVGCWLLALGSWLLALGFLPLALGSRLCPLSRVLKYQIPRANYQEPVCCLIVLLALTARCAWIIQRPGKERSLAPNRRRPPTLVTFSSSASPPWEGTSLIFTFFDL